MLRAISQTMGIIISFGTLKEYRRSSVADTGARWLAAPLLGEREIDIGGGAYLRRPRAP